MLARTGRQIVAPGSITQFIWPFQFHNYLSFIMDSLCAAERNKERKKGRMLFNLIRDGNKSFSQLFTTSSQQLPRMNEFPFLVGSVKLLYKESFLWSPKFIDPIHSMIPTFINLVVESLAHTIQGHGFAVIRILLSFTCKFFCVGILLI